MSLMHLCRDEREVLPEERARTRDKAMRDLVERGSGPMERKRAVCEKLVGQMGPRALQGVKAEGPTLKACYAKGDCKERIACIMPIIGRMHEGEARHH